MGGSQVYCTGSQAGHCKVAHLSHLHLRGQSRLTRSDSDRLNIKMSIQRSMTKIPRKSVVVLVIPAAAASTALLQSLITRWSPGLSLDAR